MSKIKRMPKKYSGRSISYPCIDIKLIELAERKAKQRRTSFSGYVLSLIEQDLRRDPPGPALDVEALAISRTTQQNHEGKPQ